MEKKHEKKKNREMDGWMDECVECTLYTKEISYFLPGEISSMHGGKPSSRPPMTENPKRRSPLSNGTSTSKTSSYKSKSKV